MNAITIPASVDERLERIRLLMLEAAGKKADAARLDKKRKMVRAQLMMKAKADGLAVGLCAEQAMASQAYEDAVNEHYLADLEAGLADAEAKAANLKWETWRTLAANKRAEMKL